MIYQFNDAGQKALNNFIKQKNPSGIFVLTDDNTKTFCLDIFSKSIDSKFTNVNIKAGDIHKNIDTLTFIWEKLMVSGADRKSLIINLGGGVISDIGGFAAVTFKRGIDFIHVPTSLLGMVDAAIGGKNGINFNGLKNQIGTIVQPKMIWINTYFLKTLPKKEFDSGYAEMLKHGLIASNAYWEELKKYYTVENEEPLLELVKTSVDIKNRIITQDPNEQNIRKLLNFGHTLGHGIESLFNYQKNIPMSHGKAVAIGMVLEAYLSYKLTGLSFKNLEDIKNSINRIYTPVDFKPGDIDIIIDLLQHDKKNEKGKVLFVLLQAIGKAVYNKEVPQNLIRESFEFYKK